MIRSLLWFSPLITLPLLWLQVPPHHQQTLPQSQKPNLVASPAAFLQLQEPSPKQPTSSIAPQKPQPPNVAPQKHHPSPQKRTATKYSPKSKAKPHPYIAPAIEIRVAISQDTTNIAIASSTTANVLDANERVIEQLQPGQAFQVGASNSTILFKDWQTPSAIWTPADEGRSGVCRRSLVQGQIASSSTGG